MYVCLFVCVYVYMNICLFVCVHEHCVKMLCLYLVMINYVYFSNLYVILLFNLTGIVKCINCLSSYICFLWFIVRS